MPDGNIYVRRTNPWIWVAVAAAVILLVLLIVWLTAARSPEQRTIVEQPPATTQQQPQQPVPDTTGGQQEVIIHDSERVREVVREKPVYVYVERPEQTTGQQNEIPQNVVVVPQDAQQPGSEYQKVSIPAKLSYGGKDWIIQPGDAMKAEPGQFTALDQKVNGQTVYVDSGAQPPYDTVYIQLKPESDYYVPYMPENS